MRQETLSLAPHARILIDNNAATLAIRVRIILGPAEVRAMKGRDKLTGTFPVRIVEEVLA